MAAPIVWGLFAAANLIGGALLRQPEINRLKAQVLTLQKEIIRLQVIIEEQQRQIVEVKLRYDSLNFLRIFEKQRLAADLKGQVLYLCAFKEYLKLSIRRSQGNDLPKNQEKFLLIYEMFTTGNEDKITDDELDGMAEYIENKYSSTIESMTVPDLAAELAALEQYNR